MTYQAATHRPERLNGQGDPNARAGIMTGSAEGRLHEDLPQRDAENPSSNKNLSASTGTPPQALAEEGDDDNVSKDAAISSMAP